ncbi:hypothetical protein EYF80_041200 [Liparis tanakae]|uniref:Uncharacterized protein n=1 Tax=Liparis tanakae TaxID=230148 RepID=A0A4Z2G6S7_9TELE|nr:hypothetical protein EYF80_041200 [Liparis tanakae]
MIWQGLSEAVACIPEGIDAAQWTGERDRADDMGVANRDFVTTSGLAITAKQTRKKWNNLKDKYKELRDPPTGKGLDAALNGQHSISPPLVVAANLTATTGGTVNASAPAGQPQRKIFGVSPRTDREG